jgi:predicted NAD/FAD-dependent oxidoreductase
VDGFPLDTGAGFFTNFYPLLRRLIREHSLKKEVYPLFRETTMIRGNERAVLRMGSGRSFMRFPFLSTAEKLQMLKVTSYLTLQRPCYDLVDPVKLAAIDNETTEQWACRALGRNVYDTLIRPGVESFWYFSCAESSAAMTRALQARAVNARFYTFKDGMDTICRSLTKGFTCRLGTTVLFIEAYRDKHSLRLDDRSWVDDLDGVVLATTAPIALQLIRKLPRESIPEHTRSFLQTQRYVSHVHAAYRLPRIACKGLGPASVPCGPGQHHIAAVTRNSLKYPGDGGAPPDEEIISVFLTEAGSHLVADYDDDGVYEQTWNLTRLLLPELPETATPYQLHRRPFAIPVPQVGRYKQAAKVQAEQRGPIVFAGDYLTTATVEGALRSGKSAALRLASTMG